MIHNSYGNHSQNFNFNENRDANLFVNVNFSLQNN